MKEKCVFAWGAPRALALESKIHYDVTNIFFKLVRTCSSDIFELGWQFIQESI